LTAHADSISCIRRRETRTGQDMALTVANILKITGLDVTTIAPGDTMQKFAELLKDKRIGATIVSKDGVKIDGIISERDLAYGLASHGGKLPGMKVQQLMTKSVVSCEPEDSIEHVMNLMTQRRIRHLPVKDGEKLIGIISISDVVKLHLTERLLAISPGRVG
jgi:CBS domain-containing protein